MKKLLSFAVGLAAVLLFIASSKIFAQAPVPALGNYGSVTSGNWSDTTTWRLWSSNGAFDSTTSSAPSSSKIVFITTGTTVTYDKSSQNCKNLIIQSGAKLKSKNVLPTSSIVYLKVNGPIVWVDGEFGNDSTDALSIESKYTGTITIGGSGKINIARLRPNSGASGDIAVVFASNANINYGGSSGTGGSGIYADNSESVTSVTFTIDPGVTLNFAPYSYFSTTSSASVPGKVDLTINVNGTLNMSANSNMNLIDTAGKSCTLNIGAAGTLNTAGKITPYLNVPGQVGSIAAINVAAGGSLNILSGGSADFSNPDSKVSGAGTFVLNDSAEVKVGALSGLDPSTGPLQTTTVSIDTIANFSFVGNGLQYFGSQMPGTAYELLIGSSSIDTVNIPLKLYGKLTVDGTLVNDSLTCIDTAEISGIYVHNTKAALPIAVWDTGSTCLFTEFTTNSKGYGNGTQTFYNVKVDFPNCLGTARLGIDGATINGDLTILNTADPTGAADNYVALFTKAGTFMPVTLMGNLDIESGASFSIGTGSGQANQGLIVHGNVTSKGVLFLNGSGVTNVLRLLGDLTIQNTGDNALKGHSKSAYADSIIFCGTGVQKFTKPVALAKTDNLRFVVQTGSKLYLDDTTVVTLSGTSPGVFTLEPGATLICGNAKGVDGNFSLADSVQQLLLSSGANYEFKSSTAQSTGSYLPDTVKNLTFSNQFADTLTNAVTVTDTARIESGASVVEAAGKYIKGTAVTTQAVGTAANQNIGGLGVALNAGTDNLGNVTIVRTAGPTGSVSTGGKLTINRNWTITQSGAAPASGRNLTLTWDSADDNGVNISKAIVWKSQGTGWTNVSAILGTDATGTDGIRSITADGVTSFSNFTVSDVSNLLPVSESTDAKVYTYKLGNYPNPFNPSTTISFEIAKSDMVNITVYNILGQKVMTVVNERMEKGDHEINIDASKLASGAYIYRMISGSNVISKKMLLLK